ncbi:hypothetical protein C7B67_24625 [filamentous cyanobacterium Phorm 6]|nr:hypothetical protein C7B67_24625 [filamentous cyanobacterium Phorm 6]
MFLEIWIYIQFSRFRSGTENTGFCLSCVFDTLILHTYYRSVKGVAKVFFQDFALDQRNRVFYQISALHRSIFVKNLVSRVPCVEGCID